MNLTFPPPSISSHSLKFTLLTKTSPDDYQSYLETQIWPWNTDGYSEPSLPLIGFQQDGSCMRGSSAIFVDGCAVWTSDLISQDFTPAYWGHQQQAWDWSYMCWHTLYIKVCQHPPSKLGTAVCAHIQWPAYFTIYWLDHCHTLWPRVSSLSIFLNFIHEMIDFYSMQAQKRALRMN